MADTLTPAQRRKCMSGIAGKNTAPEILVRRFLHRAGFRFRLHRADLPGKPDIVLPKYRAVVFVNGCFWHGHSGCKKGRTMPVSHRRFWLAKISGNKARDAKSRRQLRKLGWRIYNIWECRITREETLPTLAQKILGLR